MLNNDLNYSGSCAGAGYTQCCSDSVCLGQPGQDCYCDPTCHLHGDCCQDIDETCPLEEPPSTSEFGTWMSLGYTILLDDGNYDCTNTFTMNWPLISINGIAN